MKKKIVGVPISRPHSPKGITLIALIITIIIMLILAAVVIAIMINGGLFEQANEAVEVTRGGAVKEIAALWKADIKSNQLYFNKDITEEEINASRIAKLDEIEEAGYLKDGDRENILEDEDYYIEIGGIDIDFKIENKSSKGTPDIPEVKEEEVVARRRFCSRYRSNRNSMVRYRK